MNSEHSVSSASIGSSSGSANCGFNQPKIENILGKNVMLLLMCVCYVVRPVMVVSVLNIYRLFSLS